MSFSNTGYKEVKDEHTRQLSSRITVAPSPGASPTARPPVPACPPRRVAARRASILLYFEKSVIGKGKEILEKIYCDVGFTHATATIDVVLTHDTVAVANALAALQTTQIAHGGSDEVGRVVGVENVDTAVGEILGVTIRGEDLDCVINARGGDGGLIRMACM